jgi:type I restriction enzyme S subunit
MVSKDLKWTSVSFKEIEEQKYRLEASVFNIEVKKAKSDVAKCVYPKTQIWGKNGFVKDAHYGGRLKRTYVKKGANDKVIGFLGSAEMLQINPKPEKYFPISKSIESLTVKEGTILISRSGTIGNLTYVNKTLSRFLVSEHAIRLEPKEYGGYLYAFLKTETGQNLVKSNIHGAVINQIEPEHIGRIEVPDPTDDIKKNVHNKIKRSFDLRDHSNSMIEEAEKILVDNLRISSIDKLNPTYFDGQSTLRNYSVKLSQINDRFDASYHVPISDSIVDCLLDNAGYVLPLSSSEITREILLPGRFKRHYVTKEYGTVFLGGKQIYELDPCNKKYLSIKKHGSRIENQLLLKENMILVTRSGTIGKINIAPKHWGNWVTSEHILRVTPKDNTIAGYLYIWLNSDYGKTLIKRQTYGSVVDEIDGKQLGETPVPILKNADVMKRINDLALQANKLRSDAYYLEQEAIKIVESEVIYNHT